MWGRWLEARRLIPVPRLTPLLPAPPTHPRALYAGSVPDEGYVLRGGDTLDGVPSPSIPVGQPGLRSLVNPHSATQNDVRHFAGRGYPQPPCGY